MAQSGPRQSALDGCGNVESRELARRIDVVLPGIVDDTNAADSSRLLVGHGSVHSPRLNVPGSRIGNTDDEFGAFPHVYRFNLKCASLFFTRTTHSLCASFHAHNAFAVRFFSRAQRIRCALHFTGTTHSLCASFCACRLRAPRTNAPRRGKRPGLEKRTSATPLSLRHRRPPKRALSSLRSRTERLTAMDLISVMSPRISNSSTHPE
jgi:hypothetical protein